MKRSQARNAIDAVRRALPWVPVKRFPDRILQGAVNNANPVNLLLPQGCVAIQLQAYTVANVQITWTWGTDDNTNPGVGTGEERGVQLAYPNGNSLQYLTQNHLSISVRTNSATTQLFNVLCWIGAA